MEAAPAPPAKPAAPALSVSYDKGVLFKAPEWKRPFNRQELVAGFASELNERAVTAELAGGGRDVGIAVHNDLEKSPRGPRCGRSASSTASAAVATGQPSRRPARRTPRPWRSPAGTPRPPTSRATSARHCPAYRLEPRQDKGYSEGDLEGGPLRLAVAASYKVDLADLAKGTESSVAANLSHGVQVDAMLKVEGFSLLAGAYGMKLKSADPLLGAMAQAGYFLVPQTHQLAARFAVVELDGERQLVEARAAYTWFFDGHGWKWATDFGVLVTTGEAPGTMAEDAPDVQVRTMAQLTF